MCETVEAPSGPFPGRCARCVRWRSAPSSGARARLAAWCAVTLLVAGVGYVRVQLCVVLRSAVVPVLLALLGTALLLPAHRWLVRAKVNRSVAAGLTCAAVLAVVGGS